MKRLLPYFKGYIKESILGPLFKLLEACLELLVPLIVAQIIDVAIPAGTDGRGYAVAMCLLLVGLGLAGLGFSVTAQWFAAKSAIGFTAGVRQALYERIQSFSSAQVDRLGGATLITRLTGDMNQVQTGVNLTLRLLLRSPFVVFGAAVMAFTVDPSSALLFVLVIPVLALVVFAIMLVSIPLYKKVQDRLDALLSHTRDTLSGVRVLRAFRREDLERQEFDDRGESLTRHQRFVGRITALLNPLTYVILNLAILLLLRTGAIRVDSGSLTPGELVALYNYMSQILVELIKLADLILNITRSLASAGRVADLLDEPADDPVDRPAKTHVSVRKTCPETGLDVTFDGVSFRYDGAGEEALKDITLSAPAGAHVGIIGSTGSGKSTLVNLILRLYDATDGRVLVGGKDVKDWDTLTLRQSIGLVPQRIKLFTGTIRDNLLAADPDADEATLLAAVEAAQAANVVKSKGGLDGKVEQGGRNFSGGQRQRLAIARALVRRPRILILDDSSSALDNLTDRALREALKTYSHGMTVFTVSQRTSALRGSDSILVLEDGEVVGVGSHEDLLASCPVYREIDESQK